MMYFKSNISWSSFGKRLHEDNNTSKGLTSRCHFTLSSEIDKSGRPQRLPVKRLLVSSVDHFCPPCCQGRVADSSNGAIRR